MIEAMAGIVENIQTPNQTPAMQRIALIIIKDKSCDFSLLAVKSLFRMQITHSKNSNCQMAHFTISKVIFTTMFWLKSLCQVK